MSNTQDRPHHTIDLSHEERLRLCAEIGQIVPIDKKRVREHYEAMAAVTVIEGAAHGNA